MRKTGRQRGQSVNRGCYKTPTTRSMPAPGHMAQLQTQAHGNEHFKQDCSLCRQCRFAGIPLNPGTWKRMPGRRLLGCNIRQEQSYCCPQTPHSLTAVTIGMVGPEHHRSVFHGSISILGEANSDRGHQSTSRGASLPTQESGLQICTLSHCLVDW